MNGETIHQRVHEEIDRRRDEIVALLADLVRIPSVNQPPCGDELACQQFIERCFHEMGLETDTFQPNEIPGIADHPGWWPGSDFTDRPNVVGIRHGLESGRSLLLLAHADVVPPGPPELWRHGPFNPTVEDGALVGSGSNDDKGGLAAAIAALDCLERAGFQPCGDVKIASVVDEESAGANGTLATLLRPHIADAAIYCDGLDLDIHTANLGGVNAEIRLQVDPDQAGTTIDRVFECLLALHAELLRFRAERSGKLGGDPNYADTIWPDYAVRLGFLQAGCEDGGNPGGARLKLSAYVLPGEEIAQVQRDIENRVEAVASALPILLPPEIEWTGRMMPPSAISPDTPFVWAVANAYRKATGYPPRFHGMPMSDLFQFNLNSPVPMPTVAMGPGRWGSDGGAHEVNESVLIDEDLIPFVKTLASLIIDWCGVEGT
jgi:acetylornithine deacetylase